MADFEEKDIAVERTTHPDAQWFPEAMMGLFLHWGIHSVAELQASWAMIKDYPCAAKHISSEEYFALARKFNPQHYDPDRWLAAASTAGFKYAVLTTKHHDGYALWPTQFGDFSTRNYLDGRDLLQPYVQACRKNNIKVGFYFSFADWRYPEFPIADVDFDFNKRRQFHPVSKEEDEKRFEAFYDYTLGQIDELLTRYGKIDLLWFDGVGWKNRDSKVLRSTETIRHVREMQPGIVVNNRWGKVGDYVTPECQFPEEQPEGWWEACYASGEHWGYDANPKLLDAPWFAHMREKCANWGGNFLVDIGPAPNGTMSDKFYQVCNELAATGEGPDHRA